MEKRFNLLFATIDMDIKSIDKIRRAVNKISSNIENGERVIYNHRRFINDAINKYLEAEREGKLETIEIKNDLYSFRKLPTGLIPFIIKPIIRWIYIIKPNVITTFWYIPVRVITRWTHIVHITT